MNNYHQSVDFSYDPEPLLELADRYLIPEHQDCQDCIRDDGIEFLPGFFERIDEWGESHRTCMLRFRNIPEDLSSLRVISDICELFKNTPRHHDPEYVYNNLYFFNIGGILPPHCDLRTVGFNIPLRGVDAPVCWYDHNDIEIHQHTYSGPTLINTQIKHGSPTNTGDRLFLSLGGFTETFKEITEAIS